MSGAEIAASVLLTPIFEEILKRSITIGEAHKRNRRYKIDDKEKNIFRNFDVAHLETKVETLTLYADLPPGVSLRDIESALTTPEVRGNVKELIAGVIADANPQTIEGIGELFAINLTRSIGANCLDSSDLPAKVFNLLLNACRDVVDRIQHSDPELYSGLKQSGQLMLILSNLQSIERHIKCGLRTYRDPEVIAQHTEFDATYRAQLIQSHDYLEPPDFETKRKIPFDKLYVSPTFVPWAHETRTRTRVNVDALSSMIDRTVVLGDPGGGKSTVSKYLTCKAARSQVNSTIPFLVILRNLPPTSRSTETIVDHIENRMKSYYQCSPPTDYVEHAMLSGRALVIFDGLDELLDVADRRDITERVELFSNRYPLARVLVTSRKVGYDQARLDPSIFARYDLAGFSNANVAIYASKWFALVDSLSDEEGNNLASSFLKESINVPDLRRNPLMLALMCIIYRGEGFIPKNRPAVYERCANLLFEKWDSSRKIQPKLRAADFVDAAMKHLAYWMLTSNEENEGVLESSLVNECATMLRDNFANDQEATIAATEFVTFCRGRAWVFSDAGSTADGELLYKFTHRTFMEYFAAFHLTKIRETAQQLGRALLPKVSNQEWDVTAQLAVQIFDKSRLNGAERIFNYFILNRTKRSLFRRINITSFIVRCMSFIPVSYAFIEVIVRRVVDELHELASGTAPESVSLRGIPIASLPALLAVRTESVAAVASLLSAEIERLMSTDEAGRAAARFLIAELVDTWRYPNSSGALPTASSQEWDEWSVSEFSKWKSQLLTNRDDNPLYWFIAEDLQLITVSELKVKILESYKVRLPLDFAFVQGRSDMFSLMSYGPLVELVSFALDREEEDRSNKEIHRIEMLTNAVEALSAPPFITYPGNPLPPQIFDLDIADRYLNLPPRHQWLVTVFALISWETYEKHGALIDDSLADMYPKPIRDYLLARRAVIQEKQTDAEIIDVSNYPENQRALVADWAAGKVDLVSRIEK
ncbi:NACHT domain-containing protein [Mycolicibacterium farcinogenes]|uniref:NACHT domain-containing protein n=1 Tax=Mycolicibacterium farcinogenes TaxID=1802 RepID=A0ACD1FLG0_MYCFR|nr:NACHT domain-containing protein [Mycolicibacterium farcinogenes]QZH67903.1 NACHT domain-containing protein [Mycolicibacterium farcinogenes]